MKSKDLEKIIDNSCQEEKKAIYDNLKKVFDFLDDDFGAPAQSQIAPAQSPSVATATQKPASKWRNFFKKPARLAACVSAATAVVCLAIILPFTLNNDGGLQATTPPNPNPPQTSVTVDRFIKAEECEEIEFRYTIKEYSQLNNLSLLYVDWYDVADIMTSMHVNKEDSTDIVYFEEILRHKYMEKSIVELYITDSRTSVYELELYKRYCINQYVAKIPNTNVLLPYAQVYWGVEPVEDGEPCTYMAYFNSGNYRYVLVLRYPMDENSIFDLIDSVLAIRFSAAINKR